MTTNPKIDDFLRRADQWQDEMRELRRIALECGLTEEMKWGVPCYSANKKNIIAIQSFKKCCALMFFKGMLLKDPQKILTKVGENTRSALRADFTSVQNVVEVESALKELIDQMVELEKSGAKVDMSQDPGTVPAELQEKFDNDPALKKAFDQLTPGRQRAYLLHFSSAKQSKTRTARVERSIPKILIGKGLDDK